MKYRKKPIVIEAHQWDGTFSGTLKLQKLFPELDQLGISYKGEQVSYWKIGTLEGGHEVTSGDYIIKGIKGEFYPCKSDIFEATYEKVES